MRYRHSLLRAGEVRPCRRDLLRGLLGLGVAASLGVPATARASLSGAQAACRNHKILEIFLYAGLSHRDTTWVEDPSACTWRQPPALAEIDSTLVGGGPHFVANGGSGHDIYMGACVAPIVGTPLFERMRLVATRHSLSPHGPASAYALTGSAQGRPAFAGLGARIEARYGNGLQPVSVVLDATKVATQVTQHAAATGTLGGTRRPLVVPFHHATFPQNLARASFAPSDPLLAYYRDRYDGRLTHGAGGRVRSTHFDAYSQSLDRMMSSEGVVPWFQGVSFGGADVDFANNRMTRAVPLAVQLLNQGVRHVCLLAHRGMGSFDTHNPSSYTEHATLQQGNLWGLLNALAAQLPELDLDETMIVIHTEFGRGGPESDGTGTYHWPYGYPTIFMGGPITTSSPTVGGDIDFSEDSNGWATGGFVGEGYSPADIMAAMTLAAGIDPFQPGVFDISDTSLPAYITDTEARDRLRYELLGLTPVLCPSEPDNGLEAL